MRTLRAATIALKTANRLRFALETMGQRRPLVFGACLALQILVAGGYWLAFDLPRAREFHRYWASIDRLVPLIEADPNAVVTADLPGDLHLMLEVALDRPVLRRGETRPKPGAAEADWLISLDNRDELPRGLSGPNLRGRRLRRIADAPSLTSAER